MTCNGCNKPNPAINMTSSQLKEILSRLNLKLLNEVQKYAKSDVSYLHFSTIEVHPSPLSDRTLVNYSFEKINFNNQCTSHAIADTTDAATTPISSSQANTNDSNATTTSSSEWKLITKRAISEINKEIK